MITAKGNRDLQVFSLEELTQFKTITNEAPADHLSNRYGFISSMTICEELYKHGWMARSVEEKRVRNLKQEGFQKHMMRFIQVGNADHQMIKSFRRAGLELEVIIFGSHDGTTKWKGYVGYFRFACCNELVVGDIMEEFCFQHRAQAALRAENALSSIINTVPKMKQQIIDMASTRLKKAEKYGFAKRALEIRHGDDFFQDHQVDLWDVLKPKRVEDTSDSLYTTLNICQEKIVKGEYTITSALKKPINNLSPAYHPGIVKRAKPITDISLKLNVNQGLWQLGEQFAQYIN